MIILVQIITTIILLALLVSLIYWVWCLGQTGNCHVCQKHTHLVCDPCTQANGRYLMFACKEHQINDLFIHKHKVSKVTSL